METRVVTTVERGRGARLDRVRLASGSRRAFIGNFHYDHRYEALDHFQQRRERLDDGRWCWFLRARSSQKNDGLSRRKTRMQSNAGQTIWASALLLMLLRGMG